MRCGDCEPGRRVVFVNDEVSGRKDEANPGLDGGSKLRPEDMRPYIPYFCV